jgi:hypothetical protein
MRPLPLALVSAPLLALAQLGCGGSAPQTVAPTATSASPHSSDAVEAASPSGPAAASASSAAPTADAMASCLIARTQARNACHPEIEDPDLRAKAQADCEKADRDGKLELVTSCSSKAADDTHEACQRVLAECLAAGGGWTPAK